MAFTASAVWEVQTGGDDTNFGGGFDPGVSGFPTDGTVDANTGNTAAPVFSSASYNFVAGDVGAWVFIKSGTNAIPGWYKIASVASNKATLSAAIGSAVLANGNSQTSGPNTALGIASVGTPSGLTWGIDYSQAGASRISFTDLVIGATTTQFTSAVNPVGKNFIGNIISVTAGTGFTVQRVAVVSTSGTTATCDKSLGTTASTGGTGRLGGALASPGLAVSFASGSARHQIYVKSGTYSVTSASTNVAGGCLSLGSAYCLLAGYKTVRGDLSNLSSALSDWPVLQASGISTFTLLATTSNDWMVMNITLDGNSLTSSRGLSGGRSTVANIHAKNCTNTGITDGPNMFLLRCSATGVSGGTAAIFHSGSAWFFACESYGNSVPGFGTNNGSGIFDSCLAYGNTGASSDGFQEGNTANVYRNCVAYGNGRDGFRSNSDQHCYLNCIAEGNSGYGFNANTGTGIYLLLNCATYNNTSGSTNGSSMFVRFVPTAVIAGSGSFFTNAAAADFSLNNTPGAGAVLRATGYPHADPAGGYSRGRIVNSVGSV